jgi:DNA polymerase II small subunit
MVSNPSIINIHSSAGFSGFDVLLYHGYSFDFYVSEVASIRNNGGYDRVDLIMKFLLQKRNLAPSHTSTLYVPDTELDNLAINKVPDFFVSGHIHKAVAANYRNVTLISGSCWQSKTTFQEKVGHNPEPSRVPIVNLQTRHVKMLKLGN